MKISERISRIAERVSKMTRRLCVYDFDDTLVSSESSVTVEHGDGEKTVLDSASFAYFKGTDGDHIDFADFNNVTKPRVIKKNMDSLKAAVDEEDTRVVILTARPKGSVTAVKKFLDSLGIKDVEAVALQSSDPMDKARWIENAAGDAEEVEFTDDSSRNTKAVETLQGKIKAKVKTVNPPHPSEGDYEGKVINEVFESDTPTKSIMDVKEDQESEATPLHQMSAWWKNQTPEFQTQYCKDHKDSGYCKIASSREAGLKEVIDKITKRVRDSELVQTLTEKVTRFFQTHNPGDDLSPNELAMIYRRNEYGDDFDMPGGQELDVGWSNHAEYRTDLRDVDPTKVNEAVRDFAEAHPNRHNKVNLINRSIGKAIVDVDTTVDPERASVVTVIASENDIKKQIIERAAKVKSAKVKKYVHEGLIRKIDQAGDSAGAWMEKLEYDFKKLKPEGLMSGFEQADFNDLWFVITGDKETGKKASMNIDRIADRIVAAVLRKAPTGMLMVKLVSLSDPDRDDAGEKKIGPQWEAVKSLAEAVKKVREFITKNDLGMGNWVGGTTVDDTGRAVAYVSYNGRVWQPGKVFEINVVDFDKKRV